MFKNILLDLLLKELMQLSNLKNYVIPMLLGVVSAVLVVGVKAFDPENLMLARGLDPFKDYIGWVFFRNGPWSFPLGLNPSYGLEFSSSIVFSDSIPVMALIFKAIRNYLPETFQYFGIWTFACFALQAFFSWHLIGLMTKYQSIKFFACLLFTFSPPMLWRVNLHTALVAHFIILAAFYLVAAQFRFLRGWRLNFIWLLLLSFAVLTHFSIFMMVILIWSSSLIDLIIKERFLRIDVILDYLFKMLFTLVLILLVMWQAGYFVMSPGSGALAGYGFYRMNLLSIIDSRGWSYLLPSLQLPTDYGEGFMFFGLGMLFLWPFGIYKILANRKKLYSCIQEHKLLCIAISFLAFFAITNHVGVGGYEFSFPIPKVIFEFASIFRASGRMFWPMFYALNLICLYFVISGYSRINATLLLIAAGSLQVADTSAGWLGMRTYLYDVKKNVPYEMQLTNEFWYEAAKKYQNALLVPPKDKAPGWDQIALYALKFNLGTNAVFLARVDNKKLLIAQNTFQNYLISADWKSKDLFIFGPEMVIPIYTASRKEKDLLVNFNGFNALAPNWKVCKDCPFIRENLRNELDLLMEEVSSNQPIKFGSEKRSSHFLIGVGNNWSWPEAWGVWSNGHHASIIIPLPRSLLLNKTPKKIELNVRAFVNARYPTQKVDLYIEGMPTQSIEFNNPENNIWQINLPEKISQRGYVELNFNFKNPARPKDYGGLENDDRLLAIGLKSLRYR